MLRLLRQISLHPGRMFWIPGIVSLVFAVCVRAVHAQQGNRENFVRWAKEHALPLHTLESEGSAADLLPLKPMIGRARIVALGEPAHAMHEPHAFRNRLFRFLVEEMGFTAIVMEAGFTESQCVADFVMGGPGSATQLARERFLGSRESEELLLWMRAYNADAAHPRKIHFYGMDLSLGGIGNAWPTPTPINVALAYLARVDADEAGRLKARFEPYLKRLPGDGLMPPAFSVAEHDALTATIEDMIALLERERLAYVKATSETEYARALRSAIIARQADRNFRANPPEMQPGKIPPDAWQPVSLRDAAMAENACWALEREGPQGRVLVVAHNAHVKNGPTEGGVWSAFRQPPNATGQYLRSALGKELVIIGMSAANSPSSSPKLPPDLDSFDSALSEVGIPRFFLDLQTTGTATAVTSWLAEKHALTANLDSYLTLSPGVAFDLIVFVDKLTPMTTVMPP
jgi:erythromycin esterase